jgi:hypothetical protein
MTYTPPEPDAFELLLYQVERVLVHVEDVQALSGRTIRALADELAADVDADLDPAEYRRLRELKAVDLGRLLTDVQLFLLKMHEQYVSERDATQAGRNLLMERGVSDDDR